jgi:hypothetical protein
MDALSVKEWVDDPSHRGRQPGWAIVKSGDYARPVRRLAVRWAQTQRAEVPGTVDLDFGAGRGHGVVVPAS